ncbi:MAG: hypothetical protein QM538_01530 [Methylacidiphilales bacterium]|nr:hypothetical protein [Candidatus Methylacidiphilales bacterium]
MVQLYITILLVFSIVSISYSEIQGSKEGNTPKSEAQLKKSQQPTPSTVPDPIKEVSNHDKKLIAEKTKEIQALKKTIEKYEIELKNTEQEKIKIKKKLETLQQELKNTSVQ